VVVEIKEDKIILTKEEYAIQISKIEKLEVQVLKLKVQVNELKDRLKELESILHKNSSNSNKPPSSDGLKRVIKNNRERSNRKSGGLKGHKGKTLKMVEEPDEIIVHKVEGYCEYRRNLSNVELKGIQRCQVYELPEKLYKVIEHQVEVKECSCGRIHVGECSLKGNVQYSEKMKRLLLIAKYMKERDWLNITAIDSIEHHYGQIIREGLSEEDVGIVNNTKPKRGRKAKNKSRCLIETMQQKKEQTLRFLYDPKVSFDNNLAERDLRMLKVKLKISGCFRTIHGGEIFCRIRGYISTSRKQGFNVLDAIEHALLENPISFKINSAE